MDDFKVINNEKVTIITYEAKDFIMKVERERKLTSEDNGAIIEATLYKEMSTFVPECSYVFEVIDKNKNPMGTKIDSELFRSAVAFFFHSVLDATYFIMSVPKCSMLHSEPVPSIENVNDINTFYLYNLLSGY